MTNPFRSAYVQLSRQDQAGDLFRSSLLAAESKFFGVERPRLTMSIEQGEVDAYQSAELSIAVVDATALFSRYRLDAGSTAVRVMPDHRDDLGLEPLAITSKFLEFGFPSDMPSGEDEALVDDRIPTLAELAAQDLVEVLPDAADDDSSLDSIFSLPIPQKRGLEHIADVIRKTKKNVVVSLSLGDGRSARGALTTSQAGELSLSLKETEARRQTLTDTGMLDGVRTRRRLFYLEREVGDIHGTVSEEVLPKLGQFLGKPVQVTLEAVTPVRRSGVRGKTVYRLLDIDGLDEIPGIEQQVPEGLA